MHKRMSAYANVTILEVSGMSVLVTRQQAIKAAEELLVGMAAFCAYLYSPSRAMQLVDMTPEVFAAVARLEDRSTATYQLDSEHFELVRLYGQLADFAWEGTFFGNEVGLQEMLTEAATIEPLLDDKLRDPFGEYIITRDAAGKLARVLNAATGRSQLESGDALQLDQLAALAGISDKTIRMAANPKVENHLKTEKSGRWTIVKSDDALDWLERRPTFKQTRLNAGIDGQRQVTNAKSLAEVCVRYRERAGLSLKDLRARLNWTAQDALAYQNMERGEFTAHARVFDAMQLIALASLFQLPDAGQFARDAIRVVYQGRAMAEILAEIERIGQ